MIKKYANFRRSGPCCIVAAAAQNYDVYTLAVLLEMQTVKMYSPLFKAKRLAWRIWSDGANVFLRLSWRLRFALRNRRVKKLDSTSIVSLALKEIPVLFINLQSRKDRLSQVQSELARLGFQTSLRVNATFHQQGIIGCAYSHAEAMRLSLELTGPVMICEDDIEFLCHSRTLQTYLDEFLRDQRLDVLSISNNPQSRPMKISELLSLTDNTQTASCYVVKEHAKLVLHDYFLRGANKMDAGWPDYIYAPDIMWKKAQKGQLFFAIPGVLLARQRPSYSDIQSDYVDYGL